MLPFYNIGALKRALPFLGSNLEAFLFQERRKMPHHNPCCELKSAMNSWRYLYKVPTEASGAQPRALVTTSLSKATCSPPKRSPLQRPSEYQPATMRSRNFKTPKNRILPLLTRKASLSLQHTRNVPHASRPRCRLKKS